NVLWRISLPLITPAVLFATIVVFLLALGEVSVPTFLRYPVYPLEILTQFAAFYDFSAATVAAIPLRFRRGLRASQRQPSAQPHFRSDWGELIDRARLLVWISRP